MQSKEQIIKDLTMNPNIIIGQTSTNDIVTLIQSFESTAYTNSIYEKRKLELYMEDAESQFENYQSIEELDTDITLNETDFKRLAITFDNNYDGNRCPNDIWHDIIKDYLKQKET